MTKNDITVSAFDHSCVEGDAHLPKAPKYIESPEDARVWNLAHNRVVMSRLPVKKYGVGLEVEQSGEVIATVKFNSKMDYEDYEGGHTHHHPENNILSLIDFEVKKDSIVVTYIDGNEAQREFTFKKAE